MNRTFNHLLALMAAFVLAVFNLSAQDDVSWSASLTMQNGSAGQIVVSATPKAGFHFYGFPPGGGYNSLELSALPQDGVKILSAPKPSSAPEMHWDPNQEEDLASWSKPVKFTIPFEITDKKDHEIAVKVKWQACNENMCYAPNKRDWKLKAVYNAATDPKANDKSKVDPVEEALKAKRQADSIAAANLKADSLAKAAVAADSVAADSVTSAVEIDQSALDGGQPQWWAPVDAETPATNQSGWMIFIIGLLGGLAALLTPCVWPLIPMTVSFFLKGSKSKSRFNKGAMIYGLSIVVIYLVLGIAITLIFGAGKLNELSTSALFNIIFFVILVVFAISFLGAFDIKLPSKWSNAIDSKAENTTGLTSIFFMAFTLVLVSFSCTGPIIGTLLVEAASQGNILGPALGMFGFALGLALPFTMFAMFPSMLKEMPKSGGWLNSVKVVLGFIELILSLKFLSVADLAYGWRILDREVFIALWIVLFVLLGMYLLGKIRFSHDSKTEHVGVGRFILALFPLAFAVYLLPGLWGAPLKATSAFVPPLNTQDFNLYTHDVEYVEFDDYNAGMAYAKGHGMPVLMDFSGYGCVNCRNMEVAVFDTEQVRNFVTENFVVIKLMVDDKKALPEPITVVDSKGQQVTLETVGEKWTFLQNNKFGASSQPYYIVLDNEGRAMNEPVFYDNSVPRFMSWLDRGLTNFNK